MASFAILVLLSVLARPDAREIRTVSVGNDSTENLLAKDLPVETPPFPHSTTEARPAARDSVARNLFFEFSPTLFDPDLTIDDRVPAEGGTVRWFTEKEWSYTGWYAGAGSSRTFGLRGGLGFGKERLLMYSEGPAVSLGPFDLASNWIYGVLGGSLTLQWGALALSPSAGFGLLFSSLNLTSDTIPIEDSAGGTHPFLSLECPLRVWLGNRVGVSVAYHAILPFSDPTFAFSDGQVKLHGYFGNSHEMRLGICLR